MKGSALLMVLLSATPLFGQDLPQANRVDAGSLAAFVDAFLPSEMAMRHIPGAVLVVVSGDTVVAARGFGLADVESRRPVDPDRTIFRVASVSKVVTATAALQMVERGRLDLTQDVNAYLRSFQLPPYEGSPVTLHHLLTHTAGFDERLTGIACRQPSDRLPLSSYLAQSMPPRSARAGDAISYSNHGLSLAALLVEERSGRRFEDYVGDEILRPLGMLRSGFQLSNDAARDIATAHEWVDGRHRALPPECLQSVGAGGFATSGSDMARFMIAHLHGGIYGDGRILRKESIDRMQARQFAPHEGTSGWAYGFWEDIHHGRRGLMHDGGGAGYRALLYLLPEQHLGFFLAYNLADRHRDGELLDVFRRRFLSTYAPPAARPNRIADQHAALNLAGHYRYIRRARTTMEKMMAVMNNLRIEHAPSGALVMIGASDEPVTLTAIGPRLFVRSDGRGLVAFDAVDNVGARRLILDGGGVRTYERISFLASAPVQAAWLLSMVLPFAYAALGRPVLALVASSRSNGSAPVRWSTWLAGVTGALNLLFVVAFPLVFLGDVSGGMPEFVYGIPRAAVALLFIPPLTAALAIATAGALLVIWRDRRHRLATRVEHAVVCAALLSFVAFAIYWRVMGVQS